MGLMVISLWWPRIYRGAPPCTEIVSWVYLIGKCWELMSKNNMEYCNILGVYLTGTSPPQE